LGNSNKQNKFIGS